jgi:hypothetical protein
MVFLEVIESAGKKRWGWREKRGTNGVLDGWRRLATLAAAPPIG